MGSARTRWRGSGGPRNLRPWRVDTFKLSNDPRFEEKLVDVVGLYLDPPERAVVFSFDEKTQCQALDRTQPSLPLKPGRARTMTHDYKRNGTIDLFAALNVGTGEVLHQTRKRHTANDVLAFFKWIDLHVPRDLEIHVVLDNLSAHTAPPVAEWLAHPKRAALASALHADQLVVAEPRRGLVRAAHQPAAPHTAASTPSPPSSTPSTSGRRTGTTTPNPSSGTHQRRRSSPRSAEDEPPSPTRSNPRRTTSILTVTIPLVFDPGQPGDPGQGPVKMTSQQ